MPEIFRPLKQRARGMPGAQCTRSLACAGGKYAHQYSKRRHRKHPAFPTQWRRDARKRASDLPDEASATRCGGLAQRAIYAGHACVNCPSGDSRSGWVIPTRPTGRNIAQLIGLAESVGDMIGGEGFTRTAIRSRVPVPIVMPRQFREVVEPSWEIPFYSSKYHEN
jgi:hypothetical protein